MKTKKGLFSICLGIALIIGAITLLIYNIVEQCQTEKIFNQTIEQFDSAMLDSNKLKDKSSILDMAQIEIDGEQYIGKLIIPQLELKLPVISQWSNEKLRKAPCRYSGSIEDNNLVIMAHNYVRLFGKLKKLTVQSKIEFIDVYNKKTVYRVVSVDTVDEKSVEEVTSGEFDLTLFTCTYDGKRRVLVRCIKTDDL